MNDAFFALLRARFWPEDAWSHWQGGSLIPGDKDKIKATAEKIRARLV